MTLFGLCPSFCTWTSRLPLFSNAVRRGRFFEVFTADGLPTGVLAPLGKDGWPTGEGVHGVRLFGDMGGQIPSLITGPGVTMHSRDADAVYATWTGSGPRSVRITGSWGDWHRPSIDALRYFRPAVLRTLDWSRANEKSNWDLPRVRSGDPLQGTDRGMSAELQAGASRRLGARLWWNAPVRHGLDQHTYELRLRASLEALRPLIYPVPPILELGNELWNAGFPAHNWLRTVGGTRWTDAAATEIMSLKQVADEVFRGVGAYQLFVGGHIADPSVLEKILGALPFTPDLAGPAFYARPSVAVVNEWNATNYIPSQGELRAECISNVAPLQAFLRENIQVAQKFGVPQVAVYEAGQSLIARGNPWKSAAIQAQREPWMGDLYRTIRSTLSDEGVGLANWYSAATSQNPTDSRVDVFGLLESTDLSTVLPKAVAARG